MNCRHPLIFAVTACGAPLLFGQALYAQELDIQSIDQTANTYGKGRAGAPTLALQPLTNSQIESGQSSQEDPIGQTSEDNVFVAAIAIQGMDDLHVDVFSPIIESNIGRNLADEELRKIVHEVAELAREEGYIFARATIPEQPIQHGVLQINLDEGIIHEVRIVGSDSPALRAFFEPLEGEPAIRKVLERRLVLANDLPKFWVRSTSFLTEDGRNILEVTVRERSNRRRLTADNYGTSRIGPLRAQLSFDFRGILDGTDKVGLSFRTNPIQPSEFVYVRANYSIGLGNNGTRIGVSGSIGETAPDSQFFSDLAGESQYFSAFASHPLVRSNNVSLWANVQIAYLSVLNDNLGTTVTQDRLSTLSLGLSSNIKLFDGHLRAGVTLTRGVDLFGSTRSGDPNSSRFDGDGVFSKGAVQANWRGQLGGGWGLYAGGWAQISDRSLLSSQDFNVGGPFSARAFEFGEISGENGFAGLLEISYTIKNPAKGIGRIRPYIFVDGGHVRNLDGGFGGGSLLSAGGGIRADIGKLDFELETAVPLNRDRDQTGNRAPQINLQLGLDL